MVTVRDIDAFMTKIAPKELSEEWDNDGVMLCGNFDGKVSKVLCALEVSEKLVSYLKVLKLYFHFGYLYLLMLSFFR